MRGTSATSVRVRCKQFLDTTGVEWRVADLGRQGQAEEWFDEERSPLSRNKVYGSHATVGLLQFFEGQHYIEEHFKIDSGFRQSTRFLMMILESKALLQT